MKITKHLLYITLFCLTFSCTSDTEEATEEVVELTDKNSMVTDLSSYGLPLKVTTLKSWDQSGVEQELEVIHEEDDIQWELVIGERFDIIIEDWADEAKNAKQEIERKKELESVLTYSIIEEKDNYVIYSTSIPDDNEAIDYHFFSVVKTGENQYYTLASNPMGSYSRKDINRMIRASNSIQESVTIAEEI